ncbi:hypothetical protein [Motilibacter deserti]|uniref:Uncharacterized protein n=1 Tax=Motilibacter deserti TaxID=2714956 RepID=A0ABX0H2C4_9ACTN|nr:hypothetical protein [Motilibacter deserti]NHC15588.1 hypothetical protein [Motilibacter deserti]
MTTSRTARALSALGLGVTVALMSGPLGASPAGAVTIRIAPIKLPPATPPAVYCLHGLSVPLVVAPSCPPGRTARARA